MIACEAPSIIVIMTIGSGSSVDSDGKEALVVGALHPESAAPHTAGGRPSVVPVAFADRPSALEKAKPRRANDALIHPPGRISASEFPLINRSGWSEETHLFVGVFKTFIEAPEAGRPETVRSVKADLRSSPSPARIATGYAARSLCMAFDPIGRRL